MFDDSYATGALSYEPALELNATNVVDELATLLTSGRLSQSKRDLLTELYDSYFESHGTQAAVSTVGQLIVATPEFHANGVSRSTDTIREDLPPTVPSEAPYKAVVFFMLDGGFDSYNMLVPQECTGTNAAGTPVNVQYNTVRGEMKFAEGVERSLEIDVDPALDDQPCSKFVVHDKLPLLKELYDDGDLTFFANTGVINSKDMTKTNYNLVTRSQLFAHNAMQYEAKVADPFQQHAGTGVLGRLAEVLSTHPDADYKTNSISIDNPSVTVAPSREERSPTPLIVSRQGASEFYQREEEDAARIDETLDYIYRLNNKTQVYSNFFGDSWSEEITAGIDQARRLKSSLEETTLGTHWDEGSYSSDPAQKLEMVARLMQTKDSRGVDRDFFYTNYGGWDHHAALKTNLAARFVNLNAGLTLFVEELKRLEIWNEVTIVVASDFARTLTPNGNIGSDHAWGGNYFMMGGAVNGGHVRGQYPDDLTDAGELNLGRGRLMPTTSWDCVWNGVSQWMGATTDEQLDYCLPNRNNVAGGPLGLTSLWDEADLFA